MKSNLLQRVQRAFHKQKATGVRKRLKRMMSVTALTSLVFGGILGSTVAAEPLNINVLQSIYHVYVDGEEVGKVSDRAVIDRMIDTMKEDAEANWDDAQAVLSSQVTYEKDRGFLPTYNNEKVEKELRDELTFDIQGIVAYVGDERVGTFKSEESAKKALNQYKQQYVDPEALRDYQNDNVSTPEEPGDLALLDLELTEDVTFAEETVTEQDLMSVQEGVEAFNQGKVEEKVYHIQKGDVLGTVASKFDLSTDELLALNPDIDIDDVLKIDQALTVQAFEPLLGVTYVEEVKAEETMPYDTKVVETNRLYRGETEVEQEGQDGQQYVHYKVTKENDTVIEKEILEREVLEEPVQKVVLKGTKIDPQGTGSFVWPTVGGYISSHMGPRWGSYHKGIDIVRPSNRAILAADNGTVTYAGWMNGYGYTVKINHNNGYRTLYGHLASLDVSQGQTVAKGDKIGVMGSTGRSTGIHLHFELHKNGEIRNPVNYLP